VSFDTCPQGGEGADDLEEEVCEGDEKSLEEFLGVPKYRYGEIENEPQVGIVTAWPGPMSAASCSRSKAS